jgi:tetratricopeptide (TPR) repeat protein
MYKRSPMNFYSFVEEGCTVIKSVNNTPLGYKFNKIFSSDELASAWSVIRFHKKIAVLFIFMLFITLLYEIVFPKFVLFVNNSWYVNALLMLFLLLFVYQLVMFIDTKIFEFFLQKKFGAFENVVFVSEDEPDMEYFSLFKSELIRALIFVLILIAIIFSISPFKFAKSMLKMGDYERVIRITSIGAKIYPIAPKWYSLRGYAKFQMGDFSGALVDYDKAYHLESDGFNMMNFDNKIFIKYYLRDFDGALADFDTEIKKANNENERDEFLWDKAQFLFNIGHYNEALDLYNELLVKAEADSVFLLKDRLYLERAEVYKKLGQNDLAQQDIEKSESTDVDFEPIPQPSLMVDDGEV